MTVQTLSLVISLIMTLATASAQAFPVRCQDLFEVPRVTSRQGTDPARAAIELADLVISTQNEVEPGRRSRMERLFREAYNSLSKEFGPSFIAEFQEALEKVRQEQLLKSEKEQRDLKDQSTMLVEMTRLKRHAVGGRIFSVLDNHRLILTEPGKITVYDYLSEKILHQLKSEDIVDIPSPVLSPDRSKLYLFTFRKTGVVDLNSGTVGWHPYPKKVLSKDTVWVTKTNVSRDGTLIFCGSEEGRFFALDAKEPTTLLLFDPSDKPVRDIIESPDGKWVLIDRAYRAERLYDRQRNKFGEVGSVTQRQGPMARAFFTADSSQIIFETKDNGVFRHHLSTQQTSPYSIPQWSGQTWYVITADNQHLLSVDVNSKTPHLTVTNLTTLQPVSVGLEDLKTQFMNGLYYDGPTNTLHFWTHEKNGQRDLVSSNLVRVDLNAMGSVIQPMLPQRETRIGGVDPVRGRLFQQESGLDKILLERY